ncbi:MAG: hypothetical protein VX966_05835 [Chloroflexota bacterium]|nr:hypothetical protein [Chloroflexota bacterium]
MNKRKPIKTIKINEMGETSELDKKGRDITKLTKYFEIVERYAEQTGKTLEEITENPEID